MNQTEFAQRRHLFLQKLLPDSVAIIPTAEEHLRVLQDITYPFRASSDFYYLTGFGEPEAVAVFTPGHIGQEYILFNRPRDPEMEIWNGKRAGQMGAIERYGADQAFEFAEFVRRLPELLRDKKRVYYAFGRNRAYDEMITQAINQVRQQVRSGLGAPVEIVNVETILHEMRLRKRPEEIAMMRHAAQISAGAHVRAMQASRPGMFEYELEAELLYEFYRKGSRFPAYSSIVASGENSCILHYHENDRQMQDGDLVLIDAGCELECYASDITRTFPVNGKFSREQQAVYELVLAVQLACIKLVRAGAPFNTGQEHAIKLLTQGLKDLGLLHGDVNELIETAAYKTFYMHRVGHWLGMDVHDVGTYKLADGWRKLEPNMVLTIEPGIYISPGTRGVAEKWWNIGIRIEDDVVVTENDPDVLSCDVPKSIKEIEALMKS